MQKSNTKSKFAAVANEFFLVMQKSNTKNKFTWKYLSNTWGVSTETLLFGATINFLKCPVWPLALTPRDG